MSAPPDVVIKSRPKGPDFDWFVKDIFDELRRRNFHSLVVRMELHESRLLALSLIKEDVGEFHIELDRLQRDWREFLRCDDSDQECVLDDLTDPQRCFDKLLIPHPVLPSRSESNAYILSETLRVVLPAERRRYQQRHIFEIESLPLKPGILVTQRDAAKRLGLKSWRQIYNLCESGQLKKVAKGRITSDSLLAELKRRHL